MTIRLGTRKSPLAQAQTDRVMARLPAGSAEKILVESAGDIDTTSPLHRMERPGAFTSVLTDAILDGRIDAAVHSLKDLPLVAPPDAPIVAILARDDPADVMVLRDDARDDARPLHLAAGSRVGTSAPRRQSQVLAEDPELVPVDVRGNVGTRLRLVSAGVVDGLLMAAAAFERMDLPLPPGVSRVRLDPARFPVGPGQGTIAVQARAGSDAARILGALDDAETRAAIGLERAVLGRLGGGCGMPLGAYARRVANGAWRVDATLAPEGWEGAARVRLRRAAAEAATVDAALDALMPALAAADARADDAPAGLRPVAMTLAPAAVEAYREAFAAAGWTPIAWELIETRPTGAPLPEGADGARWVAVTSPRAADAAAAFVAGAANPAPRVAALGPATARALRALGCPVHLVAPDGTGASLADAIVAFPGGAPCGVLLPQAVDALPDLPDGLAKAGYAPLAWPVYATATRAAPPPLPPGTGAVVVASPSNARALHAAGAPSLPLIAFGPSTASAMRTLGLPVHAVASRRTPGGIVEVLP